MDGDTVLPGDWIALPQSCRLGPGLYNEPDGDESVEDQDVRACMAGVLRKRENVSSSSSSKAKSGASEETIKKLAWVDYSSRRYVPMKGDRVLGVVTKTTGRSYRVDIGSAVSAVLPELAFEGATKRNKPNLQVGEVVYARVSRCHRDMEPELSCVEGTSGKASGMGQLPVEGNLIQCSIGLCRNLLSPSCAVREALGKYFKFELTVGLNGLVWLNSASVVHVIAISNAIVNSELKTVEQSKKMVDSIVERL